MAELAVALTRATTPSEVLDATLTHALGGLNAAAGGIYLFETSHQMLLLVSDVGYPPDMLDAWRHLDLTADGPPWPVLDTARDGEARFLTQQDLARSYPEMLALPEAPPGSVAALPLKVQEEILGLVTLTFSEDRAFTAVECDFALTLAGLCALALERTRAETERLTWQQDLEAQVQDRTQQLQRSNDALAAETAALRAFEAFTESVGRDTQLDHLAQKASDALLTAFEAGSAGYFERVGDRWALRVWAGTHEDPSFRLARAGLPVDFPIFRDASATRAPMFLEAWPVIGARMSAEAAGAWARAAYPVVVNDRVVGLLAATVVGADVWTQRNRAVFTAVGRGLTLAAERAAMDGQLHAQQEALEVRNQDLETTMEQLRVLNAELDAFSYSVSHDLRSPLRHVQGFAGLLRESVQEGARDRSLKYVTVIDQAAARLSALVDALLDFARTGRAPLRLSQVDLNGLVQEVQQDLAPETESRRVVWEVRALPVVSADRGLLTQVLSNLLSNAVKYTRPRDEARIEVWADTTAQEHVLHVRDNGVGFDPKYADKLFGAFQRLHRAQDFEGVGIGLANVQRIVFRHGGQVWAQSRPDEGATFSFSLPLAPHPEPT